MKNNNYSKQTEKRINVIKRQLDEVYKMIESEKYFTDVLEQSLVIQSSLKSLDSLILENYIKKHVFELFNNDKRNTIELMEYFERSKKLEKSRILYKD